MSIREIKIQCPGGGTHAKEPAPPPGVLDRCPACGRWVKLRAGLRGRTHRSMVPNHKAISRVEVRS
jgi:hypothetical protein